MTDLNEFLENDSTSAEQLSGGALRAKLEQALARENDLKAAIARLEAAEATRSVERTFTDLAVPAQFQKAYLGEKTPEAITAWWTELAPFVNPEAVAPEVVETEAQRVQRETLSSVQQASGLGREQQGGGHEAAIAKGQELQNRARSGVPVSKAELEEFWAASGISNAGQMVPREL